jgi:hypothetical protein
LEDAATKAVGVAEITKQAELINVGVKFEWFSLKIENRSLYGSKLDEPLYSEWYPN